MGIVGALRLIDLGNRYGILARHGADGLVVGRKIGREREVAAAVRLAAGGFRLGIFAFRVERERGSIDGLILIQNGPGDIGRAMAARAAGDVIKKVLTDDVGSRAELEQRLQEMQQRGQRNAVLYVGGVNDARWVTIPLRL